MSRSAKRNNAHEWKGTLPHLPIAIDFFKVKQGVDCYFLSHAHSDHHEGLTATFFEEVVGDTYIYCTEFTKLIVLAKFPKLPPDRLIILEPQTSHQIYLRSRSKTVSVTVLNANHCAGSVMFLFAGDQMETVLYTGDFRFELDYYDNADQAMSKCYVLFVFDWRSLTRNQDATFCDPFFSRLPTRNDSISQIISLIESDIHRASSIYISTEILGSEPIILALAKHFNTKLFVDKTSLARNRYKELTSLPFLEPIITKERAASRFKIVSFDTLKRLRDALQEEPDRPLLIRPTTIWAKKQYEEALGTSGAPKEIPQPKLIDGIWYVIYSIHSSLSEMKQFVAQITGKNQPMNIVALSANIVAVNKTKDVGNHFLQLVPLHEKRATMTKKQSVFTYYDYAFLDTRTHLSHLPGNNGSLSLDIDDEVVINPILDYSPPDKQKKNVSKKRSLDEYDPFNLFRELQEEETNNIKKPKLTSDQIL